jgi:rRNA-processing protein FCF1
MNKTTLKKANLGKMLHSLYWESIPKGIGFPRFKLDFFCGSENMFDFSGSTSKVNIKTSKELERKDVMDCLARCGAISVEGTIMTNDTAAPSEIGPKYFPRLDWWRDLQSFNYIIVDTNMLLRHYCSNVLLRLLKETNFIKLHFRIPRLSILEIERQANEKKKSKTKRLALFAMTEIMFLKANKAELLPQLDVSLLTSFLEKAGSHMIDAWIRREVHDFASREGYPQCLFMTRDLANGLAAWAEGLNSCYLSEREQDELFVETSPEDTEQLAELILNAAVTFETIRMDIYTDGVTRDTSYQIEGIWSGKTPYHWRDDCVRVEKIT